ncbi:MAG TPA: hypothetical protein VKB80_37690 [Kofleriaceae bacterium]|nr:hypothetical protein [Kofleriaceae bacterium]
MSRDLKTFCLRLAALGAAACSSAYAVHSSGESRPLTQVSQPLARSPYHVELIGADGRPLATYERGDRFYVLGQSGDRYSIRVVNPTGRRVEALISVDGLDVIDGEDADFARKRGYVVPPGGDLVVDGFRTSTTQVAAFRFSSVGSSYAELKGKGRNVGVIGVAIFEEKEQPAIAAPQAQTEAPVDDEGGWDRVGNTGSGGGARKGDANARPAAPAESAPAGPMGGEGGVASKEPSPASPPAADPGSSRHFDGKDRRTLEESESDAPAKRTERPGLGTQWGEERYSAVDYTQFERANQTVPTALAELRYNDSEGLRAMGIALAPAPDQNELDTRETADPFPAARGFATPPQ